jgi:L-2-hydroxyglutarate oxidase
MSNQCDFLIIGGGIVGLSIGRELLRKNPRFRVVIVEKESEIAAHASGRNSGVLHAGFYYSPDSLKAKFCLEGNIALRELISKNNLPINNCGKIVVARNDDEISRMEILYERGMANGVELEKFSASKLVDFEPLAKTHKQFLWSSKTAVSDPAAVTRLIRDLFVADGGVLRMDSTVRVEEDGRVYLNNSPINAVRVINAAGANAIHIAHKLNAGSKYSQLPVLGLYKYTENNNLPLKRLVYPVPNPKNPFLGVHFTLTVDGKVKIGPTAIPIIGREQYELSEFPDVKDVLSSTRSLVRLFLGSPSGLSNLAITELPKISTRRLVRDGRELVPGLPNSIVWKKKKPGIRAQLVDLEKGVFEMDFVVETQNNFVHVLNAVSPGWTSAIPFAKYIVKNYLS